jgi:hypothetical protein
MSWLYNDPELIYLELAIQNKQYDPQVTSFRLSLKPESSAYVWLCSDPESIYSYKPKP